MGLRYGSGNLSLFPGHSPVYLDLYDFLLLNDVFLVIMTFVCTLMILDRHKIQESMQTGPPTP